jgi:methionyl aminopeptidase
VYAVEPFSTNGHGRVRDGKPSGIYQMMQGGAVRDRTAREVLVFIDEHYQTLPFCSRWIHAHFGTRGLLALRVLEQAGILHQFAQLMEVSGGIVAQAEHTLIVDKKGVKVTTK